MQGLRRRVRAVARGRGRRVGPGLPRRIVSSGRRGREPGARRHDVRSACDSERPTTATHGQSWSLDGCGYESAWSAFALVRALETCPKLVVRGRVELPTFRFSGWQTAAPGQGRARSPSPVEGPMSVTRTRASRCPMSCAAGSHAGSHTDERPSGTPDLHGQPTAARPRSRTDLNGSGRPHRYLRIRRSGVNGRILLSEPRLFTPRSRVL